MSEIRDCLSVLAVSAWKNTPEELDRAESAIDAYLECAPADGRHDALVALRDAYREMKLDSGIGVAIRGSIDARIQQWTSLPPLSVEDGEPLPLPPH